jgi:citrate lyase synthetase
MTEAERQEHIKKIKEILESKKIYTFKDIFVFYKGCSRATAYNNGFDKIDDIKEAIMMNKRRGVQSLIDRWVDSDNPTLQIAAFKIICDPEERAAISPNYNSTSEGSDNEILIKTVD